MMILKGKITVQQTVEKDVPDYYSSDNTNRGKAVDALLAKNTHRGETARDRLWSDDWQVVEHAISQIEETYLIVDTVMLVTKTAIVEQWD